jgi:hypothetical protein
VPCSCVDIALSNPAGDFDQCAKTDDPFMPRQPVGVDADLGVSFIGCNEPTGQTRSHTTDERSKRSGNSKWRLGEHHRSKGNVVCGCTKECSAPVEDREAIAVDKDVEGVEIAMADDLCIRPRRMLL